MPVLSKTWAAIRVFEITGLSAQVEILWTLGGVTPLDASLTKQPGLGGGDLRLGGQVLVLHRKLVLVIFHLR